MFRAVGKCRLLDMTTLKECQRLPQQGYTFDRAELLGDHGGAGNSPQKQKMLGELTRNNMGSLQAHPTLIISFNPSMVSLLQQPQATAPSDQLGTRTMED
mmetsp:Transcript_74443/g.155191  ORF Transcript_74443/g.155191 Transcript_74443/m.155191 type:complete len:100 (+) Transcript_74443:725-1024(+)